MVAVDEFVTALEAAKLDFYAGVPDSLLKEFCAYITQNAAPGRHVIAANEGGAVGMACGYHLATGRYGVVYMQNSGEGNAVNPLLSIADPDVYAIPMLLLIGWRGRPGVHDEPQHVKQGKVTCSLLETMGIPYRVMDGERWREQLDELTTAMVAENRPVALVIPKGSFEAYPFKAAAEDFPMTREAALESLIGCFGADDFIVSTTGKTSREVFEIREARGEGHGNDFLTVGGMGHASSIAFGLAIETDAPVWCLDGDGAFIMHMGSIAVIAQNLPANYHYVVNVNGAHESVGGQPTVSRELDVPGILRAIGFETVLEASTQDEVAAAVAAMRETPKAALVLYTRQGSRADLGRPTTTPQQNKEAMMAELAAHRLPEEA